MFAIRKGDKFWSKQGDWVPLLCFDDIQFYEHWVTCAQKKQDGVVVRSIDLLKEVVLGDPNADHHAKAIQEQNKIIKELEERINESNELRRKSDNENLELRTTITELRSQLDEARSREHPAGLRSIGRSEDS